MKPTPSLFKEIIWRVSAKWITKHHDCTLHGISTRCGGVCCCSPAFWPPKAYIKPGYVSKRENLVDNGAGKMMPGFACGHLTKNGCEFTLQDRPITCLLYPMVLNDNGTLVAHNRITTAKGVCRGNFGNGAMIIDTIRDNLCTLFGEPQVMRVRAEVVAGKDSYFIVPESIQRQYKHERHLESKNAPVPARTQYKIEV